jgi:outer membrane protein TolC
MTKAKIFFLCIYVIQTTVYGQGLSLKQCLKYANENNKNIKIAGYESDIAHEKVNEQIGTGLPQISASGTLTDNLKIATNLMPGELFGQPGTFIAIKSGVQYNTTAELTLSQKIFDPNFFVGLKAAKISEQYYHQSTQKTIEQTAYDVSNNYYQSLIIQKQYNLLKATLDASEKTLASTDLKYRNGTAKKIDVDKIRVSYNNTKSQLQQTELSYKQSLNNLKYQMGMPVDSSIVLSDTLLVDEITQDEYNRADNYMENRVDYQLKKTNLQVQDAQKQKSIADFLPTLSFDANYTFQAMRQEFNIFSPGHEWYQSSSIGLSLNIPIFSGFQKVSRLQQAKLNVMEAEDNLKLTEQSIKVEVSNYEIQYHNALDNIKNEKENLTLAESVYTNTQLEFQQGAASSLDLIQAESSFREAQNTYFNKLLNLYIARLDVEKSKGSLMNFINNLK